MRSFLHFFLSDCEKIDAFYESSEEKKIQIYFHYYSNIAPLFR